MTATRGRPEIKKFKVKPKKTPAPKSKLLWVNWQAQYFDANAKDEVDSFIHSMGFSRKTFLLEVIKHKAAIKAALKK